MKDLRLDDVQIVWQDDSALHNDGSPYLGVQAEATVSYAIDDEGNRRIETLTSGGLWGIQQPMTPLYKQTIEDEELTDLREHLQVFGVPVEAFASKVRR